MYPRDEFLLVGHDNAGRADGRVDMDALYPCRTSEVSFPAIPFTGAACESVLYVSIRVLYVVVYMLQIRVLCVVFYVFRVLYVVFYMLIFCMF